MDFSGQLSQIASLVAAAGGVGTASFGLVDATKAFSGGISHRGFKCIRDAVAPYMEPFALVNPRDPLATIKAGWINGTAKDDQKAAVKSLIHLGLPAATAAALVKSTRGVDADALEAAAKKLDAGSSLGEADIAVLGRFDAIVELATRRRLRSRRPAISERRKASRRRHFDRFGVACGLDDPQRIQSGRRRRVLS